MKIDPKIVALGTERKKHVSRVADIDEQLRPLIAAAKPATRTGKDRGIQRALVEATGLSRETVRRHWRNVDDPRPES